MQNKDCFLESNSVNGTIGPIRVVLNYLQHPGASKTFESLG